MENFSLLSISGPPISSSALSAFPDIMFSRATSLPGKLWCH
ncbi:SPATA46 isoform 2 [Pan troglodytes]|uniref:Spermatogenesis associated 46 n=2 Tax=Homininae TaxID=207598 RepID=V9GYQ4_HUMAN|nr:SPATA46 isoform 2 [Pan troglodytes]